MNTKHRSRILGALALLAVAAAAIVSELRHQPGTLLQKAHKIAAVGAWDPKHDTYFWLSNREVLLVTQAVQPSYLQSGPVTVHRLDVIADTQMEDVPLEAALHKANVESFVPNWLLSTDGHWLLGETNFQQVRQSWAATRIDGSRQALRPHPYDEHEVQGQFTAWLPDSKSWIQMLSGSNKYGGEVADILKYSLASPSVVSCTEDFAPSGRTVLGFYSSDRALAIYPRTGDGGGIGYVDFPAAAGGAPRTIYYQHIPANFDVQDVVLSPDRTHLAWKLAIKPLPLGLQSTINSNYVRHSAPDKAGLWVSDLNCGNLREIGTLDIRDDHVSSLRWTPDGTHLSFVDEGSLYVVPTSAA